MDWTRDLPDWPLNTFSRRIISKPHQWHVQNDGRGEDVLLIHGAGATTHTWRAFFPTLSQRFRVIAIDLPGQGFSRLGNRNRCSLKYMAQDVQALCTQEGWQPKLIIGHSAGAALALALSGLMADRGDAPPAIVGINAALGRFEGVASWLFPMLAKVLALNPLTASAFTMGQNHQSRARRLIANTGSQLDEDALSFYAKLFGNRSHVDGTLQMMSQWNTDALNHQLPQISARALLITGQNDTAVAPRISEEAADALPHGRHLELDDLGHLAHEEDPDRVLAEILSWYDGQ